MEWAAQDAMYDLGLALGFPERWNVCAFCGEWSWVHPPHDGEPCPHQSRILESMGMAADAQRNLQAFAGQHMSELTKHMRNHLEGEGEDT